MKGWTFNKLKKEEDMREQITPTTTLSTLAESAAASGEWWKEDALDHSELVLPTRVLRVLESAGITTVEELKAAGPARLRKLEGIGKLGFDQIIAMLRALDRQNGGGSHDHEQGKISMR
jgi:DNA-directed RNA polymerase alpha subunit